MKLFEIICETLSVKKKKMKKFDLICAVKTLDVNDNHVDKTTQLLIKNIYKKVFNS